MSQARAKIVQHNSVAQGSFPARGFVDFLRAREMAHRFNMLTLQHVDDDDSLIMTMNDKFH
eukprot:3395003-Amphidinium_carterae.1